MGWTGYNQLGLAPVLKISASPGPALPGSPEQVDYGGSKDASGGARSLREGTAPNQGRYPGLLKSMQD